MSPPHRLTDRGPGLVGGYWGTRKKPERAAARGLPPRAVLCVCCVRDQEQTGSYRPGDTEAELHEARGLWWLQLLWHPIKNLKIKCPASKRDDRALVECSCHCV